MPKMCYPVTGLFCYLCARFVPRRGCKFYGREAEGSRRGECELQIQTMKFHRQASTELRGYMYVY